MVLVALHQLDADVSWRAAGGNGAVADSSRPLARVFAFRIIDCFMAMGPKV